MTSVHLGTSGPRSVRSKVAANRGKHGGDDSRTHKETQAQDGANEQRSSANLPSTPISESRLKQGKKALLSRKSSFGVTTILWREVIVGSNEDGFLP
jgi:hypothetical protein